MKHIYLGYEPTQLSADLKGETLSLEEEIRQAMLGNQTIDLTSALQYDEEKDGVKPETDIRTDRFDLAMQATTKYAKSLIAQGAEAPKKEETDKPKVETETKED